jgi:hypothetical protein
MITPIRDTHPPPTPVPIAIWLLRDNPPEEVSDAPLLPTLVQLTSPFPFPLSPLPFPLQFPVPLPLLSLLGLAVLGAAEVDVVSEVIVTVETT